VCVCFGIYLFLCAGLSNIHKRAQPPGNRLLAKNQLPKDVAKDIGDKVSRAMTNNKGLWADGQQEPGGLQFDPHTKISQLKAFVYNALGRRVARTCLKRVMALAATPGKASHNKKLKQNAAGDPAARKALCYFLAEITSGTA
jgi:hypothetical protein